MTRLAYLVWLTAAALLAAFVAPATGLLAATVPAALILSRWLELPG